MPEGQDLRVVAQHRSLYRIAVVRGHCPDPLHLVGGDCDAKPGSTNEQRPVDRAIGHHSCRRDGDVGISRVLVLLDAHILNRLHEVALQEISLDGLLVLVAGFI